MLPPKTVSRMDAWFEPPWMGLRRVFGGNTQFMSRCQCICLKALFTTDMNRKHLAETRRKPTYTDVGNADIASLHGCNLVGQCICPWMDGSRTTQEQLSRSNRRGAYICHPWGLGSHIPVADGLSKVLPIHVSRYYLWNESAL